MSINQINSYSPSVYSTTSTTNTQSTQGNDDTTKVKGSHHHHHHHKDSKDSSTSSKNIQSNGTDTIELSSQAVDALSSATKNVSYGQTYSNTKSST